MGKTIALLSSGGDAPGMNAAIRAAVRSGLDSGHTIFGIVNGYSGLIAGELMPMNSRSVANIIQTGGTILKTARCKEFNSEEGVEKAKNQLETNHIDALIVIGGNGSFRGALDLSKTWNGQIVGIPGTIDNDLYGTDETIGFDTAINTALYAVDKIRDTADSHGRFFLIEVMGRLSGYIALHVGIAGGAEEVFIPETSIDIHKLCNKLNAYRDRGKKSSIIIIAEGYRGGTPQEIAEHLKKHCGTPYRIVVLGHLLRGGSPTAKDRILASKLGNFAVRTINDGKTCVMVGCINQELTTTPLQETVDTKKSISDYELRILHRLA